MTTYHIYFKNKYSQSGGSQPYTLYRERPLVFNDFGIPVHTFSNSFLTQNVSTDGVWNIDINDVPYAYCGTSTSSPLKAGDMIAENAHKLVNVYPSGNGSTLSLYNNGSHPAFRPEATYTAPSNAFNIVTERDFTENLKFVAGFSGVDGDGISRPLATCEVNPGQTYSFRPTAVFYLGEFASHRGALIDDHPNGNVATINFDANPGQYNAIVTHNPDGNFDVRVVTAAVFAMEIATAEQATSNSNVQLIQLKSQAKLMSELIDAALGVSTISLGPGRYQCMADWRNDPPVAAQVIIVISLRMSMIEFGYVFESSSTNPMLSMIFTHTPILPTGAVFRHWVASIAKLVPPLSTYLARPRVRTLMSDSPSSLQLDTSEFSPDIELLPRPQFRCTVEWLRINIPNIDIIRKDIALQLEAFMMKRAYFRIDLLLSDSGLRIDFYRALPTTVETARADWIAAYDSLDQLLKRFVFNPITEGIVYGSDQAQVNISSSEVAANIFPPLPATYIGSLDWIEGPDSSMRDGIAKTITEALQKRQCRILNVRNSEETLSVEFFHAEPYSLSQAKVDWNYACDAIGMLRNFITNIQCEDTANIKDGDASASTFPPVNPTFEGQLTWLEGAPPLTREAIVAIIVAKLKSQQYSIGQVDIKSPDLSLLFSHKRPWDLKRATKDWLNACDSITGNLRMFITDPRCRNASTIQKEGDTLEPALPTKKPSYIGFLKWLEGPNKATRKSIIDQLTAALRLLGNKIDRDAIDSPEFLALPFFHDEPSSLQQASKDWLAAFNSINDFQRMFVTGPKCYRDRTFYLDPPFGVSAYVGGLTWLEGPNYETREDIINQLKKTLQQRGNETLRDPIDFDDFLLIPFTHPQPSSLSDAEADWLAAYNSIEGFQRMSITSPWCEIDGPIHHNTSGFETNGTNGTNGVEQPATADSAQQSELPPVGIAAAAPEAKPAREEESLESKKRRALALLEREGLVGFGGVIGA